MGLACAQCAQWQCKTVTELQCSGKVWPLVRRAHSRQGRETGADTKMSIRGTRAMRYQEGPSARRPQLRMSPLRETQAPFAPWQACRRIRAVPAGTHSSSTPPLASLSEWVHKLAPSSSSSPSPAGALPGVLQSRSSSSPSPSWAGRRRSALSLLTVFLKACRLLQNHTRTTSRS